MTRFGAIRVSLLGGLAAVSAVVAHAGPAGITRPGWLLPALAGGLIAATALGAAAAAVEARSRRLSAPGAAVRILGIERLPFSAVLGSLLLCQWAAHVALVRGGVESGAAAPLLHIVLAVAAAWLFVAADRRLIAALEQTDAAVAAMLARAASSSAVTPARSVAPLRRRFAGRALGRAPPIPAAG